MNHELDRSSEIQCLWVSLVPYGARFPQRPKMCRMSKLFHGEFLQMLGQDPQRIYKAEPGQTCQVEGGLWDALNITKMFLFQIWRECFGRRGRWQKSWYHRPFEYSRNVEFFVCFLTAACKLHPTRMKLTFWIHLDAILPQDCVVGTVLVTTYQSCQLHDTVYM